VEPDPDLVEANLLIASEADPGLDIAGTIERVDGLAADAVRRGATCDAIVAVLREAGFTGDRDAYDDPRNSFLNTVLERRRGLPILLSALTMGIARRVGVPIEGVGLPGHFVVADRSGGAPRYLDPFDGWTDLDEGRLREIVRSAGGGELASHHLEPVGAVPILRRMLLNLRGSYLRRRRLTDALWTVEVEAIVAPDDLGVGVERRALLIGLGRYDEAERSALDDLSGAPSNAIRAQIDEQLGAIAELRLRMN
jgi:regulator of sirC expression with transglutaminase-like and TPR domain